MQSAAGRAPGCDAGAALAVIERFLKASREPALIEPGEEILPLKEGNYLLESRNGRLLLQAWDETHNLVRRVKAVQSEARGKLELLVERFARREGRLLLVDLARPSTLEWGRRSMRMVFRERFREFLTRQFPGWRLAELSTEANLEHSLSPAYPRAFLTQGQSAWAAIAAAPECQDVSEMVSFGLIWLDYLRHRERKLTVEGLVLYLPTGREDSVCWRVQHLSPEAARYELFVYSKEGYSARIEPGHYRNLDTRLVPPPGGETRPSSPQNPEAWLESQVLAQPEIIDASLDRSLIYQQVLAFAGGQRGIFDLLGTDRSGRLVVIELKVSADLHLPLQALDYWMRVRWHHERNEFRRAGFFPGVELRPDPPRLLLVSPALEFHSTTETILGYFASQVDVERVGLGVEWRKGLRVLFRARGSVRPGHDAPGE